MMPGSRMPVTPMQAPAASVPANSATMPPALRNAMPSASTISNPPTVRSAPKRRASTAAAGANTPRHTTGSVVSRPAVAPDRPVPAATCLSTGDRLESAGRRFTPTSTSPATSMASAPAERRPAVSWSGLAAGCGGRCMAVADVAEPPMLARAPLRRMRPRNHNVDGIVIAPGAGVRPGHRGRRRADGRARPPGPAPGASGPHTARHDRRPACRAPADAAR